MIEFPTRSVAAPLNQKGIERTRLNAAAKTLTLLAVMTNAYADYQWPLDLPPAVTSSFGEYRPGRFHAGIDLRTNGTERDVRAAGDGYVSRIRCSPQGYGKAVYVTLNDGNTAVYAHLSDFAPGLRDFVFKAQHERQSYTVDLCPDPKAFPVTHGAVIAKTGQTGVGEPHLHYEIRDPAERPINPGLLGVTWPDTTPPVFQKVLIMPWGPESRVDGDICPAVRNVNRSSDGTCTCDPVRVAGRIGFGAAVIDPANDDANKLGIHVLRAVAEGRELFRIRNDRLSYDNIHNGAVAFHPFLENQARFLVLWRWPGNVSEPYQQMPGDGWYEPPPEPIDVCLEARDFSGNTASVRIPLVPCASAETSAPIRASLTPGSVDVQCIGEWLVVTAAFPDAESTTPSLVVDGAPSRERGTFHRVDDRTFRAGYQPVSEANEVALAVSHERLEPFSQRIAVFHRGEGEQTAKFGPVEVSAKSDSPYGTLFTRIEPVAHAIVSDISVVGRAYRVWPDASPVDAPVRIAFPAPEGIENTARVHMYRETDRGWERMDTVSTGQQLTIATREYGTFVAMEDNVPPQITNVVPENEAQTGKRPAIGARVMDVGSGIAEITGTCGGQWLLMEYDPERQRVDWARDEDLPSGSQELVFTAVDVAGNTSTVVRDVTVSD